MEITPETIWQNITDFFRNLEPEYWGIGGISLLLLIILFRFTRRKKAPKTGATSGGLQVNTLQIAPLGRDAFLKLYNPGTALTLSKLDIAGRKDITVKNALAGHKMDVGSLYSLLLEATGDQRIEPNFTMEITYVDDSGTAWRQTLDPGSQLQKAPKVVKK